MASRYIKNTLLNFLSFFLIAISLYIFISLVSHNPSDSGFFNKSSSTTIENLGGPLGANISDFLFTLIGLGAYLLLFIGCVWAYQSIFHQDAYSSIVKSFVRFISSFILLLSFCSILEYYFIGYAGGFIGKEIFFNLSNYIGFIGSLIFFIIFIVPAASLSLNFSWLSLIDHTGKGVILINKLLIELIKKNYSFIKNIEYHQLQKFLSLLRNVQIKKPTKKETKT